MLETLERCFPTQIASEAWQTTLREWIPSYGQSLRKDESLAMAMRERSTRLLGLQPVNAHA